jgi:hypothetical protein
MVARNVGWLSRVFINGPSAAIFEKWEETPSSEQIRNMIYSTMVSHFFDGNVVLWPRQTRLVYTDFVLPYPMKLDFEVSSFFLEDWPDKEKIKSVRDSIDLHGADLDAVKVVP